MKKRKLIAVQVGLGVTFLILGSCSTKTHLERGASGEKQKQVSLIASIGDVLGSGGNTQPPGYEFGILILRAGPKEGPMQKPCGGQTGKTPYDTGITGSCSGNNYIEIPLPTTGLSLSYNSLMAGNLNTGFGRKISLSVDERFYSDGTSNQHYLIQGDGTILPIHHASDGLWSSSDPRTSNVLFERHTTGRMEVFPNGSKAEFTTASGAPNEYYLTKYLDKNGNATTLTRLEDGRITQITDPFGAMIQITYTGNLATSIRDNAGGEYQLGYDLKDRLTSVTYPDGRKWVFTYNATHMTKSVSADGRALEYTYFPYALASIKDLNSGYRTVYAYHKLGSVSTRTTFDVETESFDSNGRMLSYSKNGKIHAFTRGSNGLVSSSTDSIGRVTTYAYTTAYGITDPRPTSITYPAGGGTKSVTYMTGPRPGNITQMVLQKGNVKTVVNYDAWHGGITSIVSGATGQDVQTFQYDLKGNLLKKLRNGRTMLTYTRDALGRATSITNEVGLKTSFVYNAQGRLSSRTDPFGRVTNYVTDGLGNPTQITEPLVTTNHTFNNMAQPLVSTTRGNASGAGDISTHHSYSYFGSGAPANMSVTTKASGVTQRIFDASYLSWPGQLHRRILTDSAGRTYNMEQ